MTKEQTRHGGAGKTHRRERKPVRSTSEAMRLLEERRAWFVRRGRYVAALLSIGGRTVTSRDVWAKMVECGDLDTTDESPRWLGAVFVAGQFEWTGEYRSYRDMTRNVHERAVKVWRLTPGATVADPGAPPPAPSVPEQLRLSGGL